MLFCSYTFLQNPGLLDSLIQIFFFKKAHLPKIQKEIKLASFIGFCVILVGVNLHKLVTMFQIISYKGHLGEDEFSKQVSFSRARVSTL